MVLRCVVGRAIGLNEISWDEHYSSRTFAASVGEKGRRAGAGRHGEIEDLSKPHGTFVSPWYVKKDLWFPVMQGLFGLTRTFPGPSGMNVPSMCMAFLSCVPRRRGKGCAICCLTSARCDEMFQATS